VICLSALLIALSPAHAIDARGKVRATAKRGQGQIDRCALGGGRGGGWLEAES
jgi:hypothetical protein